MGPESPDEHFSKKLDKVVDNLHRDLECTQPLTKEFIKELLKDIRLFDYKNRLYGCGNIAKFSEYGILVRVADKLERLQTMLESKTESVEEPVRDSWADSSIYCVMARLVRAGLWPK